MATPGWYPDPAGQPNTFRYWDGQAWSEETSPSPYVAPPGSTTPPPPPPGPPPSQPPDQDSPQPPPERPAQPMTQFPGGPPAQPGLGGYSGYGGGSGWSPMSAPSGSGGSGVGKTVLIVALAVLLLVGVGLGGFFGVRALTGDNSGSEGSDESSQATDDTDGSGDDRPEALLETCGAGAPGGGAPVGKRMRGGGLVMPTPSGYTAEGWDRIKAAFTFADQVALAVQEIQKDKWISNYTVGGLPTSPGYDGLDQAAESVMECMANSDNFFQSLESRKDLGAEEVEVDGQDAYRLVSEIRVDDPELTVDGDQVSVVVVDTGDDGTYGLYVGVVPIGDDELIEQEEKAFGTLEVGGGRADTA